MGRGGERLFTIMLCFVHKEDGYSFRELDTKSMIKTRRDTKN